jgi:hypothetical protein
LRRASAANCWSNCRSFGSSVNGGDRTDQGSKQIANDPSGSDALKIANIITRVDGLPKAMAVGSHDGMLALAALLSTMVRQEIIKWGPVHFAEKAPESFGVNISPNM